MAEDNNTPLPPDQRPAIFDRLGPKDRGHLTKVIRAQQQQQQQQGEEAQKPDTMAATEQTLAAADAPCHVKSD